MPINKFFEIVALSHKKVLGIVLYLISLFDEEEMKQFYEVVEESKKIAVDK